MKLLKQEAAHAIHLFLVMEKTEYGYSDAPFLVSSSSPHALSFSCSNPFFFSCISLVEVMDRCLSGDL